MLHNENLQRFSNVILVLPENFRKTQRFIPDINTETKAKLCIPGRMYFILIYYILFSYSNFVI